MENKIVEVTKKEEAQFIIDWYGYRLNGVDKLMSRDWDGESNYLKIDDSNNIIHWYSTITCKADYITFWDWDNEAMIKNPDQTLLDENKKLKDKLDKIEKEFKWLIDDGLIDAESGEVFLDKFFKTKSKQKAEEILKDLSDEVKSELKKLL